MAFVGITTFVSCNSLADDGVGLRPMSNTEDTFYFDTGSHTISIVNCNRKLLTSKEFPNEGIVLKLPLKARENPIVDHVEKLDDGQPKKARKERKKVSENKPITRMETPEERAERTVRVTKEINLYAKTILFDVNKSVVKTQAEFILDNIAKIMNENDDFNFIIEGHTDNTGVAEHNLQLSQERADAIKAYLIRKGVKAKRLEAKGYGQTRPIESNDTERGREINRRVEINIAKEETK